MNVKTFVSKNSFALRNEAWCNGSVRAYGAKGPEFEPTWLPLIFKRGSVTGSCKPSVWAADFNWWSLQLSLALRALEGRLSAFEHRVPTCSEKLLAPGMCSSSSSLHLNITQKHTKHLQGRPSAEEETKEVMTNALITPEESTTTITHPHSTTMT